MLWIKNNMKYELYDFDHGIWDIIEVTDDLKRERYIAANDGYTTEWRDRIRGNHNDKYSSWITKEEVFLKLL